MRILIAGGSGLVGEELKKEAESKGHIVSTLSRKPKDTPGNFYWDPEKDEIEIESIANIDTIVNLAGDSISNGRWTTEKKNTILSSRILSTRLIVNTLKSNQHNVSTLINASAIGYYPSSNLIQDESSQAGTSFLSAVCKEWEATAKEAEKLGIRVALTRIGIVLTKKGAALEKMLLPFKLGLGGAMGNGNQYWSWVSLKDVVTSILFIAENNAIEGPINICSPHPISNKDFTKELGKALSRPTIFNVPSFVLKLALGEMADELLLSSLRIHPSKLLSAGYQFKDEDLLKFLESELRSGR